MTTSVAAAAAVVVVAALAACSGGSGAGRAAQDPPASASVPNTVGSTPEAAGRDGFCARVAESMAEGFGLGATNAPSPEAMRQAFERSTAQGEATVAVAPAEIRPDLLVLGAAVAKLRDALAVVNYDISAVGPDAGIPSTFSSPEFQQAATNTLAYVKGHCGVDTGGVTGGAAADREKS